MTEMKKSFHRKRIGFSNRLGHSLRREKLSSQIFFIRNIINFKIHTKLYWKEVTKVTYRSVHNHVFANFTRYLIIEMCSF